MPRTILDIWYTLTIEPDKRRERKHRNKSNTRHINPKCLKPRSQWPTPPYHVQHMQYIDDAIAVCRTAKQQHSQKTTQEKRENIENIQEKKYVEVQIEKQWTGCGYDR